ncbi:MAG: NnrS family protein, partial [Chloroflexi bacterium]|nr:NnrS family protein [Chloroflexota bacterium]
LGHTGRPLTAGAGTTAAYLLISVAAMARVTSPLLGELELAAIWISGGAWTLGYGIFTVLYFPVFTKPHPRPARPDPRVDPPSPD